MRNTFYTCMILVILVASMALVPVATTAIPKAEAQKAVLRLQEGASAVPAQFGPLLNPSQRVWRWLNLMFEPLVELKIDGTFMPWLADRWTVSSDGLTYTFYLNRTARWSDGRPLTADDVVFTYNKLKELNQLQLPVLDSATALDTYTVQFKTTRPAASFMMNIAASSVIAPKHIWQNVSDVNNLPLPTALKTQPSAVVGSGPFILKEWIVGQSYTFAKNPSYWKAPVYVDEIQAMIYDVPDAAIVALNKGDLDASGFIGMAVVSGIKNQTGVTINIAPAPFMGGVYAMGFDYRKYPLNIKEVRQAIDLAIDRRETLAKGIQGWGELSTDGWMPASIALWYNPKAAWRGLDYATEDARIAAANAMLDKLGFTKGADGVRVTPNGTRLEYDFIIGSGGENLILGQLAQKYTTMIGVKLNSYVSANLISDVWTAGRPGAPAPKWGSYIKLAAIPIDPDYYYTQFYSNPPYVGPLGYAAYQGMPKDPTFDALLLAQSQELDYTKRKEIVWKIQEYFKDMTPAIPLTFNYATIMAWRNDRFTNWQLNYAGVGAGQPYFGIMTRGWVLALKPIGMTTTAPPTTTTAPPTTTTAPPTTTTAPPTTTTAPPVTTVTTTKTATATTTVTAPAEGMSLWGWVAVVVAVVVCIPVGYMVGRRKPTT